MTAWPVLKKAPFMTTSSFYKPHRVRPPLYCSVRDLETPRSSICCSSIKTCNDPPLPREDKSRFVINRSLEKQVLLLESIVRDDKWMFACIAISRLELPNPPRIWSPLPLTYLILSLSNLKTCFLLSLSSFKWTWCASQFWLLLHSLNKKTLPKVQCPWF